MKILTLILFGDASDPDSEFTIHVVGEQWAWSYRYDFGDDGFTLPPGANPVVPLESTVDFEITSKDVINSFEISAFGIRLDAVPGLIATTRFKAARTGTYFGQCSEMCGEDHADMPVKIEVVSPADYAIWAARERQ